MNLNLRDNQTNKKALQAKINLVKQVPITKKSLNKKEFRMRKKKK